MAFHNIKLYPYGSDEDDEQDAALNESIQDLIPFAVVGSEKTIVVDGKPVRGRQNRWGVINGKLGAYSQLCSLSLLVILLASVRVEAVSSYLFLFSFVPKKKKKKNSRE